MASKASQQAKKRFEDLKAARKSGDKTRIRDLERERRVAMGPKVAPTPRTPLAPTSELANPYTGTALSGRQQAILQSQRDQLGERRFRRGYEQSATGAPGQQVRADMAEIQKMRTLPTETPPPVVQRAAPLTATAESPLITRGVPEVPTKSPDQIEEEIAVKLAKGGQLTDDELKFQFRKEKERLSAAQQPVQPQIQPAAGQPGQMMPEAVSALPTAEQYLAMTPEQQMQVQQQAFQQQAMQRKQMLEQQFGAQQGIFDQRMAEQQAAIEAARTAGEAGVAEALAPFKEETEAQAAEARRQVERQGASRLEGVKDMQSFSGFGRSTKTMEILDNARADTQAQVADIERQSGRAIREYQASLLDKVNAKVEQMENRLMQTQDAKDALGLEKAKAQSQLMGELFAADPSSPQNMIATAEKLQKVRLEEQKMAAEERKEVYNRTYDVFKYMMDSQGSAYFNNLDPESLSTMESNLGLPAGSLAKIGPTMEEQKQQWEQGKYLMDFNWQQEKLDREQNFDLQKLAQMQGFDWEKMLQQNDFDVEKMMMGFDNDAMKEARKAASVSYGTYSGNAVDSNGQSLMYGDPQPHTSANTTVVDFNPKVATAYADGYKFSTAKLGGLAGQCAWFAQQLTTLGGKNWTIGNTIGEKKTNLAKYAKQGKAFYPGQEAPQVGMSIVSNDSKTWGHVSVINGITPDGKLVLTESNRSSPLTVSNTRIISPDDPSIIGFLKTEPKGLYKVAKQAAKGIDKLPTPKGGAAGLLGALPGIFGKTLSAEYQRQTGGGTGSRQQSSTPAGEVDEYGLPLDPQRKAVRSGAYTLSASEVADLRQYAPQAYQQYLSDLTFANKATKEEKPPTEGQYASAGFAARLKQSTDIFDTLEDKINKMSVADLQWQRSAPGFLKSPEMQQQEQAERNFINAQLRKESGAAISPEEYQSAAIQYFPQPGDSPQVLAQKKQNRQIALENMRYQSGPAAQEYLSSYSPQSVTVSQDDIDFYNSL